MPFLVVVMVLRNSGRFNLAGTKVQEYKGRLQKFPMQMSVHSCPWQPPYFGLNTISHLWDAHPNNCNLCFMGCVMKTGRQAG